MPLTACPECRHVAAVRDEQLGHRTRCPNCSETFRPERLPISFRRIFRAGHPAGAALGTLLLLAGLAVGGLVVASGAWEAGLELTAGTKVALNCATGSCLVGVLLLIRHIRALASRPQPVGARPLLSGKPALPTGSKRVQGSQQPS